jgi:hypothetical protein
LILGGIVSLIGITNPVHEKVPAKK